MVIKNQPLFAGNAMHRRRSPPKHRAPRAPHRAVIQILRLLRQKIRDMGEMVALMGNVDRFGKLLMKIRVHGRFHIGDPLHKLLRL